jgi:hypothetical protein
MWWNISFIRTCAEAAGQQAAANGPSSPSAAKSAQSAVKKLGTSALKFWRVRDVSAK